MTTFIKDPKAVLDYAFDWATYLHLGETVVSYVVTPESGLTLVSDAETDGVIIVWLSGGSAGESYEVECSIVTSDNREDTRTIEIDVQER